jgi:hypothetical protein
MISEQQQKSENGLPASSGQGSNIVEFLDRILDKGIVISGDITLLVAGNELLSLRINLVIASIETAKRYGIELPWEKWKREDENKELYNKSENIGVGREYEKKLVHK